MSRERPIQGEVQSVLNDLENTLTSTTPVPTLSFTLATKPGGVNQHLA